MSLKQNLKYDEDGMKIQKLVSIVGFIASGFLSMNASANPVWVGVQFKPLAEPITVTYDMVGKVYYSSAFSVSGTVSPPNGTTGLTCNVPTPGSAWGSFNLSPTASIKTGTGTSTVFVSTGQFAVDLPDSSYSGATADAILRGAAKCKTVGQTYSPNVGRIWMTNLGLPSCVTSTGTDPYAPGQFINFTTVPAISVSVNVTCGSGPPPAETAPAQVPLNFSESATTLVSGQHLTLEWNQVFGATWYDVDQNTDSLFSNETANTQYLGTNDLSWTNLLQVNSAAIYYYRVRARNSAGVGPWSSSVSVTVNPLPPVVAPTVVPAATISASTVFSEQSYTVSWTGSPNATGYYVSQSTTPNFSSGVATAYYGVNTPGEGWQASFHHDVTSATEYYYEIAATNSAGTTGYSTGVSVMVNPGTAQGVPAQAPTGLTGSAATLVTNQQFTLRWNQVSGATWYDVDQNTDSSFGNETPATNYLGSNGSSWTNLLQVNATTVYYFRIRARNGEGVGPWTGVVSVTVNPH